MALLLYAYRIDSNKERIAMIEQKHLDLLLELNADENPHSGGELLDHLRGTHDFLAA